MLDYVVHFSIFSSVVAIIIGHGYWQPYHTLNILLQYLVIHR